jgi:hypothetical protein
VTFALTANGLKDVKTSARDVRQAIARGLPATRRWRRSPPRRPACWASRDRLGTIAPGKIANLTVTRGDLFSEQGKWSRCGSTATASTCRDAAGAIAKGKWVSLAPRAHAGGRPPTRTHR